MDMTKLLPQVAIWPSLATTAGRSFTLIARGIYLVCHPCHCFEDSILNSDAKRFSELCGKGGRVSITTAEDRCICHRQIRYSWSYSTRDLTSCNDERDTERFLKALKASTGRAVEAIWQEHGAALKKVIDHDSASRS